MSTPEYHRAWRQAHRESERARKARYRATAAGRASRAREYARRASRAVSGALPPLHTGHPLLEAARELVPGPPSSGTRLAWHHEVLTEDLRSEAVLAQLEGRDPAEAVRSYRAREAAWARRTGPLLLP